jgi:hypothetical protein
LKYRYDNDAEDEIYISLPETLFDQIDEFKRLEDVKTKMCDGWMPYNKNA